MAKQNGSKILQLKAVCQEIEQMKNERLVLAHDVTVDDSQKNQALTEMDNVISLTEHIALKLMQEQIDKCGDRKEDDGFPKGIKFAA